MLVTLAQRVSIAIGLALVLALASCGESAPSAKSTAVPTATRAPAVEPPASPSHGDMTAVASPILPTTCALPPLSATRRFGVAFVPEFCAAWDPARWTDAVGFRVTLTFQSQSTPGQSERFAYDLPSDTSEFVFPRDAQFPDTADFASCIKRDLWSVELTVHTRTGDFSADSTGGTRHCGTR